MLSGYTSHQGEKFAGQYRRLPRIVQSSLPRLVSLASRPFTGSVRYRLNRISNVCSAAGSGFVSRLTSKLAHVSPAIIGNILGGERHYWHVEDFLHETLKSCQYRDTFYKLMYLQFMVTLPDQMLTKVDRMSMANSLETRVPFLDHRLVEFMARVDKNVKMPGYERKRVLTSTIAKSLPSSLLSAPKRGFSVPLREWFKGEAFDSQLMQLHRMDLGLRGDVVQKLVDDTRQGRQDNGNVSVDAVPFEAMGGSVN